MASAFQNFVAKRAAEELFTKTATSDGHKGMNDNSSFKEKFTRNALETYTSNNQQLVGSKAHIRLV